MKIYRTITFFYPYQHQGIYQSHIDSEPNKYYDIDSEPSTGSLFLFLISCPTQALLRHCLPCMPEHSHRIRGRCLVPRPGNAVPIRGSGSKRVSVPFKIGSRPGLRGVAAPLLADLIGIRRLRVWFLLDNEPSMCTMV